MKGRGQQISVERSQGRFKTNFENHKSLTCCPERRHRAKATQWGWTRLPSSSLHFWKPCPRNILLCQTCNRSEIKFHLDKCWKIQHNKSELVVFEKLRTYHWSLWWSDPQTLTQNSSEVGDSRSVPEKFPVAQLLERFEPFVLALALHFEHLHANNQQTRAQLSTALEKRFVRSTVLRLELSHHCARTSSSLRV